MNRRSMGWMGLAAIALTLSLWIGQSWQANSVAISSEPLPLAQATTEELPVLESAAASISGVYEDPQGNFQIGILDGVTVSSVSGSPLFQTADGSLAYGVVRIPLTSDGPVSDIGLVALAQQTLGNGEGFQTQSFIPVPEGGLQIPWSGRLSQGNAPPQPVSGTVLAKQQGATVYLLTIAALESAAPQVPQVLSTLSDTLTIL
ncbi:MAG: hypothetical protein AAGA01_18750 [Cyanobacteria bacterium P01_E01_bin.43]